MSSDENQNEGSAATTLGMVVGLIVGEVGAAVATIGALWVAFTCLNHAERAPYDSKWPLHLVSGGIFVAVLAACRWRRGK